MGKNKNKNNKKNAKKLAKANIGTTPVKAEAVKKEESAAAKTIENIKKRREADAEKAKKNADLKAQKKAAKKAKQEKKYAAAKARIEARRARKKTIMDKLIDSKKTTSSEPVKITLDARKARQEERKKIAYNRHIASIKRRCHRLKLDDATTQVVIDAAKDQWDKAKEYNITMVFVEGTREKLDKFLKDKNIKQACVTNSTAFVNNVPKAVVDELRVALPEATLYQYRTDKKSPFDEVLPFMPKGNRNKHKKGGDAHSRECSKSRSVNFYNLRRLKKASKEALQQKAEVKPVNKKPTQVKETKAKSTKQAA